MELLQRYCIDNFILKIKILIYSIVFQTVKTGNKYEGNTHVCKNVEVRFIKL